MTITTDVALRKIIREPSDTYHAKAKENLSSTPSATSAGARRSTARSSSASSRARTATPSSSAAPRTS